MPDAQSPEDTNSFAYVSSNYKMQTFFRQQKKVVVAAVVVLLSIAFFGTYLAASKKITSNQATKQSNQSIKQPAASPTPTIPPMVLGEFNSITNDLFYAKDLPPSVVPIALPSSDKTSTPIYQTAWLKDAVTWDIAIYQDNAESHYLRTVSISVPTATKLTPQTASSTLKNYLKVIPKKPFSCKAVAKLGIASAAAFNKIKCSASWQETDTKISVITVTSPLAANATTSIYYCERSTAPNANLKVAVCSAE